MFELGSLLGKALVISGLSGYLYRFRLRHIIDLDISRSDRWIYHNLNVVFPINKMNLGISTTKTYHQISGQNEDTKFDKCTVIFYPSCEYRDNEVQEIVTYPEAYKSLKERHQINLPLNPSSHILISKGGQIRPFYYKTPRRIYLSDDRDVLINSVAMRWTIFASVNLWLGLLYLAIAPTNN